ncbi:valine--tRNA ligase [Candidatus Macondimonas diazotrophica]|jgi:valyl-tRNA synthetase|uniref:Valine--tRNA ligase n=1 Tax=Candidatus Macondimonas diazotrophica TaxID=2305248 RepID=A0A4Z0F9J3_9GAMM|nr:valine--tRNA ligase [Candidatus Macondimonas diazotrophica]TFZ82471.1 valine--tRNA ligase [Candidatus Macondimonas diazotrophica]
MDKSYEPHAIESRWYAFWEDGGHFRPDPAQSGEAPYCIMIPPPNVTGTLHMGHAFQDTLMDVLTRYHRMRGAPTLWQPGTDHAGIATQMVVERQLSAESRSRHDLGRDAFLERVWQWKAESGNTISRQLRRMGASADWSRERFTMDEGLSAAVTEVFVRLHEEGLIYRGKRLVNWDPVLHTAISDLEVVSEEEAGSLWHIRYPIADGEGRPTPQVLIVATTRPETLLGDTAVAVHPEDERYRHLIGRQVLLPLTGRLIPIIADDYVDPAFGTGCVKITPAHDFNDHAVGSRHDLPLINIFTIDARINEAAPTAYQGLDRFDARARIVADLETQGLLEAVKPHRLMVPRGDRTGAVIEPYLTDQWYVDLTRETQPDGRPGGLAAITRPAIAAVQEGRIRIVPENWAKTYFQWLENIQDWCISRQIWWGHRIPAWYDEHDAVYVGHSEAEVRARHGIAPEQVLRQDEDVLDTWFSSALWPFSTLGWPEQTPELRAFYPTSVLVTGFDIIFFWVARMIMMGLKFTGEVPFREVYIHGLVRDAEGQKMSKSKGNVLDPIDLIDGITLPELIAKRTSGLMQPQMAQKIEQATKRQFPDGIPAFGTDALRYTFCSLASTGRDIKFDLGRIEGYRNFCNKLWNAARFVLMNCEGQDTGLNDAPVTLGLAERWIISRLQRTEATVREQLDGYRFDLAASAAYEFVWGEYCDWYLELAKTTLQDAAADAAVLRGTRRTLVRVLETALRLLHPFMPFITEALWQSVAPLAGRTGATIMTAPYPTPDASRIDAVAEADMDWVMGFILGIRRIRGEMDIAPSRPLPVCLQDAGDEDRRRLAAYRPYLDKLARLESVLFLSPGEALPEAALAILGDLKIAVPLAGLIDVAAELKRLDKQLERTEKELTGLTGRLENPAFVERAPAAVVEKERARAEQLRRELAELNAQSERLARL